MKKNIKIAVLGGGIWGTILAQHLGAADGVDVRLWEFFPEAAQRLAQTRRHPHIPGFRLASEVFVTSDIGQAARNAAVLFFAMPSAFVRAAARRAAISVIGRNIITVSASKGVESATLATMCEIIESEISGAAAYALSGPSFAREVAAGLPTRIVLAGEPGKPIGFLSRLLSRGNLKIETCADRRGVELCGALKNVFAIGCGILDGLGWGDNAKAAFMSQAMDELSKIVEKSGGRPGTAYGLAGLGDFLATGSSAQSRNRTFGEKIASKKTKTAARQELATVVEGLQSLSSATRLAYRAKVQSPILAAVRSSVAGKNPAAIFSRAMKFGTIYGRAPNA
ncbi:MAG: NAD(P)H-dependent glycerol-3-phosphate dehydrogenase [Elusimicrobiota bacterium]